MERARPRIIRYRTISALLADYERNLSRGSLFLNARNAPRLGTRIRIVIALSRPALRTEVSGHVVRVCRFGNVVNEAPGAQVAFDGQAVRYVARLMDSLRHLLPRSRGVPRASSESLLA